MLGDFSHTTLVIQTLRNAMMGASFCAASAAFMAQTLTGLVIDLDKMRKLSSYSGVLNIQPVVILFFCLGLLFTSFFSFTQVIRLVVHLVSGLARLQFGALKDKKERKGLRAPALLPLCLQLFRVSGRISWPPQDNCGLGLPPPCLSRNFSFFLQGFLFAVASKKKTDASPNTVVPVKAIEGMVVRTQFFFAMGLRTFYSFIPFIMWAVAGPLGFLAGSIFRVTITVILDSAHWLEVTDRPGMHAPCSGGFSIPSKMPMKSHNAYPAPPLAPACPPGRCPESVITALRRTRRQPWSLWESPRPLLPGLLPRRGSATFPLGQILSLILAVCPSPPPRWAPLLIISRTRPAPLPPPTGSARPRTAREPQNPTRYKWPSSSVRSKRPGNGWRSPLSERQRTVRPSLF